MRNRSRRAGLFLTLVVTAALGCVSYQSTAFQSEDFEVEVGEAHQNDRGGFLDSIEGRATGARNLVRFECYIFDDQNGDQRVQDSEIVLHYECDGPPSRSMQLCELELHGPGGGRDHIAITAVGHFDRGEDVRVFVTAHRWSQ